MADLDTQDVDNIINELNNLSSNIGSYSDGLSKRESQEKLERDLRKDKFNNGVDGMTKGMAALTGSYNDAASYLGSIIAGGLVGKAIGSLVKKSGDLSKTYQDLAAQGNNFNGSMFQMLQQSAASGLSLEQFSAATQESGLIIKSLGDKEWPRFQKQMRAGMLEQGNFAMSIESITRFSGQYLEAFRLSGSFENKSRSAYGKNIVELAHLTQNLSDATGKARDEIASLATGALQNTTALARIQLLPPELREQATQDIQKVTTILAGQAGKAGEFMANAFAEAAGRGGFSQYTTQGETLIKAGLGHLANRINVLSQDVTVEGAVNTIAAFKDGLGANIHQLSILAAANGEGSAEARELLQVYAELKKVSLEEIRDKEIQQKGITQFFGTIETVWNKITAGFWDGFLKNINPFLDSFGDFNKSGFMEGLGTKMAAFGSGLGRLITMIFDNNNMTRISNWFNDTIDDLSGIESEEVVAFLGDLSNIASVGTSIFTTLFGMVSWVADIYEKYPEIIYGAIGAIIAFKGAMIALNTIMLGKKLFDLFKGGMVVNAASVIINDGGLGGGMFGGDKGKGKKPRGKIGNFFSKAGKFAGKGKGLLGFGAMAGMGLLGGVLGDSGSGGKAPQQNAATKAAALGRKSDFRNNSMSKIKGIGSSAKSISKTALKSGIKKIPFIGAIAALGFGLTRAKSGDLLGAAMEVGSGVASIFPGIGTAASLGIDAALMARDSNRPNPEALKAKKDAEHQLAKKKGTSFPSKIGGYGAGGYGMLGGTGIGTYSYFNNKTETETKNEKEEMLKKAKAATENSDMLLRKISERIDENNMLMLKVGKDQNDELKKQNQLLSKIVNNR